MQLWVRILIRHGALFQPKIVIILLSSDSVQLEQIALWKWEYPVHSSTFFFHRDQGDLKPFFDFLYTR